MRAVSASELSEEIAKQTEKAILNQLNDFIKRDLIHVKYGPFVFVREPDSATITYKQTVELCLKDREYVEYLEEDNKKLRGLLKK